MSSPAPELRRNDTASDAAPFAAAIRDRETLLAEIAAAAGDTTDTGYRKAALKVLRQALADGRQSIADALAEMPLAGRDAAALYSALTDQIVCTALDVAARWLHPLAAPTATQRLAVLAVGGYGRGEMAPASDVDLLFLTPWKQTAWGESMIESTLYLLWDLKLKVGQSVRTVDECLRLGRDDITIRTALLERRPIWGAEDLTAELEERLWSELFASTTADFVEAKLAERELRHDRSGGSRYLVEPNVKEGKGGLRDLQTLYWIMRYVAGAEVAREDLERDAFTEEEIATFHAAEAFLWSVRCHMHLIAGRATEQLSFDLQVDVARTLGYRDHGGRRAVERFMQDYFTHAKAVGELSRILLVGLEARHLKHRPGIGTAIRKLFGFGRDPTPEGFVLRDGRMSVADEAAFLSDPLNMLRVFQEGLRTGLLLHSDALRMATQNLDLIDEALRQKPAANRIFLDLLLGQDNPERALRRMNETGVLGAFLPEFGRIVAMMQFNMYHRYTVDEHIITCVSILHRIEQGEMTKELPLASRILAEGVDRTALYVALLLHDVGKGADRDHSEYGAEIAAEVTARLGLEPATAERVVWLVRHHLLMSDTAQKRDIADPGTIKEFVRVVQTPERLRLLLVLTACDIMGVGPGRWNNWKATLLRALFHEARQVISGADDGQTQKERAEAAKTALAEALADWEPEALARELDRHYTAYWLGLDTPLHTVFAGLFEGDLAPGDIRSRIEEDADRDATRACFVMGDHPGIFSRIAGALAMVGANVVDARTFTTSDGLAASVFWLQDGDGQPYDTTRLASLRRTIRRTLGGELIANDALRSKNRLKRREQRFDVPTTIRFDNNGSELYTIIEVDTRDRPRLLYDLTSALAASNVAIVSAIIATYGEQVVDAFYVKDLFGLKLHESKHATIRKRLLAAIERSAEGAA
ncbi:MAG: [protein-PII] uridylyltransferase [Pseudomonadota bacterium]